LCSLPKPFINAITTSVRSTINQPRKNQQMNNPIVLALITSLCFGLAGPAVKMGFNKGLHTDGYALSYGIGLLSFALVTSMQRGFGSLFPNTPSLLWSMTAGILCAIGFKTNAMAFAIPTSLVAVVTIMVATYPMISASISLPLMKEANHVLLPKLIIGALFIIVGGYLVSTSTK